MLRRTCSLWKALGMHMWSLSRCSFNGCDVLALCRERLECTCVAQRGAYSAGNINDGPLQADRCAIIMALAHRLSLVFCTREQTTSPYRIGSPRFGAATAAELRSGTRPSAHKLIVQATCALSGAGLGSGTSKSYNNNSKP